MKRILCWIMAVVPLVAAAQTPGESKAAVQRLSPTTTGVMVLLTVKDGVTQDKVTRVLPGEVRATVKLYLEGRIRQWFSRADGRGVIFLVDAKSTEEARTVMESLPLHKENLVDYQYIPVGPLMPLRFLLSEAGQ